VETVGAAPLGTNSDNTYADDVIIN
jgi:hypothetical protein